MFSSLPSFSLDGMRGGTSSNVEEDEQQQGKGPQETKEDVGEAEPSKQIAKLQQDNRYSLCYLFRLLFILHIKTGMAADA
jgi:hypothetical protein